MARQFLDQGRKLVDLVTDLGVKTSITVDHLCMCSSGKNIKLLLPDFIAAYAGPGGSYIIFSETKRKAN